MKIYKYKEMNDECIKIYMCKYKRVYRNNKYIEMCIKIYIYLYIILYKHENIQI